MNRRTFLETLAVGALALPAAADNPKSTPAFRKFSEKKGKVSGKYSVVLVGDNQRTSSYERLFLNREQNDRERVKILDEIACEDADALFFLGDCVCYGEDEHDWQYFDEISEPLHRANMPAYCIPGNHDYGLTHPKRGNLRHLWERFPHQNGHFPQLERVGTCAFVLTDSNFDYLPEAKRRKQSVEFEELLCRLDEDESVKNVVVLAHHPPFSNSDMGANDEVIKCFAKPFLNARKTAMFFSGHVHSYERFAEGGKFFVVSGGGGGPRRAVSSADERPFRNDIYRNRHEIRPFHYLRLRIVPGMLLAESVMLGKNGFFVGDRFRVSRD